MRKLVSLSRRTTIATAITLAAAAAAVTVTFTASANATPAAARQAGSPPCRLATLNGTYLFAGDGWSVSGSTTTPLAFAGSEHFNGAGRVQGTSTSSFGGTITRGSAFTGTYTVAASCTGTLTIGTTLHFDLYIAPSGDRFTYIQTDPGSVSATTEQRATRG
jgi:hypothetical protein